MKQPCEEKLMDLIIEKLAEAPDDQVSPRVKKMIKKFRGPWWRRAKHTPAEKFDFINQFRKSGDLHYMCEVSDFVGTLCDLQLHYERP